MFKTDFAPHMLTSFVTNIVGNSARSQLPVVAPIHITVYNIDFTLF